MSLKQLLSLILALVPVAGAAQVRDSVAQIPEVIISRYHINDSLVNAPAAISILDPAALNRSSHTEIASVINLASGVFMQSGAFNTNRISIRGIGARTPFGTNKIRAFYGTIPLTSGDSETTIEDINTENISQVEIIKGPMSSVYGAGLGGAIIISPPQNNSDRTTASVSGTYGSFGTIKNNYNAGWSGSQSGINVNHHKLQSDGWRNNSAYFREGTTISGDAFRSEKSRLYFLGSFTYMKAFIPSSISREAFENNPSAAAPTWAASKGYEQYRSYMGGIGFETDLGELKSASSLFFNGKSNYEPRPFDILSQHAGGVGARTQLSGTFRVLEKDVNFVAGGEYFTDWLRSRTYENRYQENNGNGTLQGDKLAAVRQQRSFVNGFGQLRFTIIEKLDFQGGLNLNATTFSLLNEFPAADRSDQDFSYDVIWSPQASVIYRPTRTGSLYLSASHGFSLPGIEETLTPNGTINSQIRPETGYNFEAGGKCYLLRRQLYVDVAVYSMAIRDLLVARRVGDDQYVGVNAGKTLHRGLEFSVRYDRPIAGAWLFSGYISGSVGDFEFVDFVDAESDFSGNDLTGVPNNKFNSGLTLSRNGIYISADASYVDEIPLNDSNSDYSERYALLNFKGGFKKQVSQHLFFEVSAGVNNATDKHYASMVLVNATAPAGNQPRYFYPGQPVNYYGRFLFSYRF